MSDFLALVPPKPEREPGKRMFKKSVIITSAIGLSLSLAGCVTPDDPLESAIKQSIVTDCSSLPQMSTPIDAGKELVLRDLSVVEDPCRTGWTGTSCASNTLGRWTFGHLMAVMSGNADPASATARTFVKNWLAYWLAPQTVNPARPQTVAARPLIGSVLLFRWLQASGCTAPAQTTLDPEQWRLALQACATLDLKAAPFRLLGIANRIDLDGRDYSGNNGVPGELRFVFGIYNTANPTAMSGNAEVIFEYHYPNTFPNQWWASMFHRMSGVAFGPSFASQLQSNVTDFVTEPGSQPGGPNGGSAIGQIRTTENAFDATLPVANRQWEFRQFGLPGCATAPCPLVEAPVSQTPPTTDNNSDLLTQFMTDNQDALYTSHHVVPASMLGGSSLSPSISSAQGPTVWNTTSDPNTGHTLVKPSDSLFSWTVRHNFAFSTCNGCHYRETANFNQQFHFGPRAQGAMSQLSPFLARTIDPDPARNGYPVDMLSVDDPNLDSVDPFNGTPIYFQYNEIWRRSCEVRRVYFQTQQAPFTTPTGHN
jgi:hypothetical protein